MTKVENQSAPPQLSLSWLGLPLLLLTLALVYSPQTNVPSPPAPELTPKAESTSAAQDDVLPDVFLIAPRELRRALELADEAIDEERFAEASSLLGDILLQEGGEDFFLPMQAGEGTLVSVKHRARQMVDQLPPQGREVFELRFGRDAEAQLESAVANHDWDSIALVAERYFHTTAGFQAMILTGRHHLDENSLTQAIRCFSRVRSAANNSELLTEASLLEAFARQRLVQNDEAASDLIDSVVDARYPVTIEVDEQSFSIRDPRTTSARLEQLLTSTDSTGGARPLRNDLTEWPLPGGVVDNNGGGLAGVPLFAPKWWLPVNDEVDEQLAGELATQFADDKLAAIPGVQPLVVDDYVIVRTPQKVIGVHLQTGKRTWLYPWEEDFFGLSPEQDRLAMTGVTSRKKQLLQRLWEDSIHSRMSSDGHRIFFVDGLGYATGNRISAAQGVPGQVRITALSSRETNHLVALEVSNDEGRSVEGKLAWRVGDSDGMDDPELANIFFLGPPLPVDGTLYALAEKGEEIVLLALSAKDGRVQWSQQLARVDEVGGIDVSGIRRLAGATPTLGQGILLCPTSAGAVVAVDPTTRALLWAYQFPTREPLVNSVFAANNFRADEEPPGKKWVDGSIIVADGKVLITPVESRFMYCLDLYDGALLWEQPLPRDDELYIAGVRDGTAILVGTSSVQGVRLDDCQIIWRTKLDNYGRPSGKGFLSASELYLPTSSQQLLKLEVATGQVEQVVECERVLGNLVCVQGAVVSHSFDSVAAYDQDRTAREIAERRLAENPNDPQGLSLQGQLQLQASDWHAAIRSLTQAYKLDPTAAHSELLVAALLQGLRDEVPNALQTLAPYEDLLLASPARLRYLQLKIEVLVREGVVTSAFDELVAHFLMAEELTSQLQNQSESSQLNSTRPDRDRRFARTDRWLKSVMTRVKDKASPIEWEAVSDQITRLEKDVIAQQEPKLFDRYELLFGVVQSSETIRLWQAEDHLSNGLYLSALLEFHALVKSTSQEIAGRACVGIAEAAMNCELFTTAQLYLTQLETEFGDVVCREDKTGQELATLLAEERSQELKAAAQNAIHPNWPAGQVQVSENGDLISRSSYTRQFREIQALQDDHDGTLAVQINHNQNNNGLILDANGELLSQFDLRPNDGGTQYYGASIETSRFLRQDELAVIVSGYDIVAIDLTKLQSEKEQAVLWRRSLLPEIVNDPTSRLPKHRLSKKSYTNPLGWTVQFAVDTSFDRLGAVGSLSPHGFCFLKRTQLVCVDRLTGETAWKRSDIEKGSDLIGNDEIVIVVDPMYAFGRVFRIADGEELAKIELDSRRSFLASFETSLLSFDATNNAVQLRLYDARLEKVIWDEEFPLGTRAAPLGSDRFATLGPDGDLAIRSLKDAHLIWETQLENEKQIRSLWLAETQYGILVSTNENNFDTGSADLVGDKGFKVYAPSSIGSLTKGRLYCLDPEDGHSLWNGAAQIEQFCLPDRLTYNSPIVPLVRHHPAHSDRGAISPLHTEIAVIDLRDGRLLARHEGIPQNTSELQVTCFPQMAEAELKLNEKKYSLRFTNLPQPDASPADTTPLRASDGDR